MIFLAGSLNMNGGSTFLLRMAKEFKSRGEKMDVVVLSNVVDSRVRTELEQYAHIIMLHELVRSEWSWVGTNQLSVFLPFHMERVRSLLVKNNFLVHAMGIFGVALALRWNSVFKNLKISAGVYHQNEFLFSANDFFSVEMRKMFAALPATNIVFFNEFNRTTYSRFFSVNYDNASVLPIGINLPAPGDLADRKYIPGKFVSIGNLNSFKTYNEHTIRVMGELVQSFPDISYDIYGAGEHHQHLSDLIEKLGLTSVVRLKGLIPYSEFAGTVKSAIGFIGSGTAIVEAAALGVPSIVGIESIKEPMTYGYLSDVEGLSYNEKMAGLPLVSIREKVQQLMTAPQEEIVAIGERCVNKATEFSIDRTVEGFLRLKHSAVETNFSRGPVYWLRLLVSFLQIAVLDKLGINQTLRERRNQSSVPG